MKQTQLIQEYLKQMKRKNRSAGTIQAYRWRLNIFNQWCDREGLHLLHVEPSELDGFMIYLTKERNVSSGTRGNYIGVLKSFYGYLLHQRHILRNPVAELPYPRRAKQIRMDVLSCEEIRVFLEAVEPESMAGLRDLCVLRLFIFSGLRAGEIRNLREDSILLKEREIIIRRGKGKKDRLVFFDRQTQSYLADYIRSCPGNRPSLFLSDTNRPLSHDFLGNLVSGIAAKAKLRKKITPHSLRRTFAGILLKGGCNLKGISELMGHERLVTTAKYTQIDIAELSSVYLHCHPRTLR